MRPSAPLRRAAAAALAAALVATAPAGPAEACTGMVLTAENGDVVYGRTMEWGAFDLHSRLMAVPPGTEFASIMPDGAPGLAWTARFGAVGLDGVGKPIMSDGMNTQGLATGLFYHPGVADYPPFEAEARARSISPVDLATWILTSFATVDEVRTALGEVRVVPVVLEELGFPPPVHLMVADASGARIVVEFLDGETRIFDAPLGVITNSPSYDWHMTNLRNYVNLSPVAVPTKSVAEMEFAPLGAGSGMIGLPGDFTPPSRFVRAVAFGQTARATEDGRETIYELFRVLDNFNVPLGAAEGTEPDAATEGMRSATLWTTAHDLTNGKLHYHTAHNRRVRQVDLRDIDFDAMDGITHLPLDRERTQDMEAVSFGR